MARGTGCTQAITNAQTRGGSLAGIELRRAGDQEIYLNWFGEDRCHWRKPGNIVWNAWQRDELVASIEVTVFRSPDALEGQNEHEFGDPCFCPADPNQPVLFLQGVYVDKKLRGQGLGEELIALAGSYGLPLYAEWANPELGDHCHRLHPPLPDADTPAARLAAAVVRAESDLPLPALCPVKLQLDFDDLYFSAGRPQRELDPDLPSLVAACVLGPLFEEPSRLGLHNLQVEAVPIPGGWTLTLEGTVDRPALLAARARLAVFHSQLVEPEQPSGDLAALRQLVLDGNPRLGQVADHGLRLRAD